MRQLSQTLLAAQQEATRMPYVEVKASNQHSGAVNLHWERLYQGNEDDYYHAAAMPGDGSLVRVRVTPPADARKLYRQRVAAPGPQSDFSQWTYCGQYSLVAVACCALGAEVSIFWINTSRQLYQLQSQNCGASWGNPQLLTYSPTTAVYGLAAAYKPNGDIGLFFADQNSLYVMQRVNGEWGNKVAWDKSTGDLSGVAAVYDSDWSLFLTGQDSGGDYKLWSLVYGDGGEVAVEQWSDLKIFASAPADGDYEYRTAFMAKPDIFRGFFIEKFNGNQSYSRLFWSHSVPESSFTDNLWREPVPFNLESTYGLAVAHHGDYAWLSAPYGVWRAKLAAENLDLSADVLTVKEELAPTGGRLSVELANDDAKYSAPGEGDIALLDIGCRLDFSPGYVTSQGNEASPGATFILESYEHISAGGKAGLVLTTLDGWGLIEGWRARHQFRWNKDSDEMSVKDLLAFVLGRAGLKLAVKSASSALTNDYPDFTINPGASGGAIVRRLLSFVSDGLFIEGDTAYVVNPLADDEAEYSYGTAHAVFEGSYIKQACSPNRLQVEGYDPAEEKNIVVDSFTWGEIERLYDRAERVEDSNIASAAGAEARGEAILREAEMAAAGGAILVPVNCGQQIYDVIDISDSRAGLSAAKRRVTGLTLVYNSRRGQYRQKLELGGV
ncbi:MAG: hypothetical protein PVJ61_00305 [Dehalococcoidia bacterium]|jgi:hypothetical protein